MVGQQLGVVGRAAERLDPARGQGVPLAALGPRDLPVRDVPDEDVAEGVLGLAGHRRAPLAAHELLALEPMELVLDGAPLAVTH